MSGAIRALLNVVAHLFFRRVEVASAEKVPPTGPLLFVLNHQNGLVDPLVLLGIAPRPSAFLAKSTLYSMPVVGWIVKAAGSIPIYRRTDGADTTRNVDAFKHVWTALEEGKAIAIFPEGTSHSDPQLKPFKAGAARIALGAVGVAAQGRVLNVVPAGLYYTGKTVFRSSVLLSFGDPIPVAPHATAVGEEPPEELVDELTAKFERALAEVTLQADQREALALVTRAERIFSSAEKGARGETDLAQQFELRQRFVAGYAALREHDPERLEQIERMIERHEAKLALAGVDSATLVPGRLVPGRVVAYTVRTLGTFLLMLPVALVGIVINFPAYRLVGPLATKLVKTEIDVIATQKIVASGLVFPITWVAVGWLVGAWLGVWWGVVAGLAAPFSGYIALRFLERLDRFIGATRGFMLMVFRPGASLRLVAEGRAIRKAILALQDEPGAQGQGRAG